MKEILLVALATCLLAAILPQLMQLRERAMYLTGRDLHIDAPLSNLAVMAFGIGQGLVGDAILPVVPVDKQSNLFYVIDKATWLRLPTTDVRAPKTPPKRVEWKVSSAGYFARNHALAGEVGDEDRANADNQIMLEQRTTLFVTQQLNRLREQRIANIVSSISNCGSGLAVSTKWSNFVGSSPLSDVTTAHAFVRQTTGMRANTCLLDYDTYKIVRRHPELLDQYKYTREGMIQETELADAFSVTRLLIGDAVVNTAKEGQAAVMSNIWPNMCWIGYVDPNAAGGTMQAVTYGLAFRWTDPILGVPLAVRRYRDADEGKKTDVLDIQYYQDERVVGQELSYLLTSTI
jgi:hypothetical protein